MRYQTFRHFRKRRHSTCVVRISFTNGGGDDLGPDISERGRAAGNALAGRPSRKRACCRRARLLLKDETAYAVLLTDCRGVAPYVRPRPIMPMLSFDEILLYAVGHAAESLEETHSRPAEAPTEAAETAIAGPEVAARHAEAAKNIPAAPSDAVALARWCAEGRPNEPGRWASRHTWITHTAKEFVKDFAGLILKVARKLYAAGHVGPADLAEVFEVSK